MKKIIILLLSLQVGVLSFAESNDLKVVSKIKGVTVYLSGAQVKRTAKVKYKKGINKFRFEDVSPRLNQKTIQVKGKGEYIILDVKKHYKYPEPKKVVKEDKGMPKSVLKKISRLEDSIENHTFLIADVGDKLSFLTIEKDLLLKNQVFTKDSLPVLDESLTYLRKQLLDIHLLKMRHKRSQTKMNKELVVMQNRLTALKNYKSNDTPIIDNNPIHYIEVTVQGKQDGYGSIDVSYLVNNAGWSPMYDIRVENTSKPVGITMKANVYQNTGEEWSDVNLTLSTNNPFRNKVKPELSVWYLNYYNPNRGYYDNLSKSKRSKAATSAKDYQMEIEESDDAAGAYPGSTTTAVTSLDYTVKTDMMANAEYKISLPYTVESNNQAHMVAVTTHSIKSKYYHYLVPKYDREAYIIAKLTDWEDLNLLPSKANIFYDGSYIGETRINPTANDTLNVSLGNDPSVVVKMQKNKDKTKDKIFTNQKEKTVSYDLKIKNNSLNTINIVVEDHIPVSNDESIKIEMENKSGGKLEKEKGMLTWEFRMKAKGSKKINYTYRVKYDKEKNLNLSSL